MPLLNARETTSDDLERLLGKVSLGEQQAFSVLYDATSMKLFGVCLRILGNKGDAEEALQEVYIKVWQKAQLYAQNDYRPMTWLITLARNHAIDKLRARKSYDDIDALPEPVDNTTSSPEQVAESRSERVQIEYCLDTLQDQHAAAVRGAYLNGDSYQSLADQHAVPINTMRTWLRRSLLKLKDCLADSL